jgi:hypothetical protein
VRREAIEYCWGRAWREGIWDSMLAGRMVWVVEEIEGAKLVPGGRDGFNNAAPSWLDPRLRVEDLGTDSKVWDRKVDRDHDVGTFGDRP